MKTARVLGVPSSLVFLALSCCGTAAAGTCEPDWLAVEGVRGVNGRVHCAVHWDPDGDGPLEKRLVVGGTFTVAGDTPAVNVAMWDGSQWLPFGAGLTRPTSGLMVSSVLALAVLPDGRLLAGGNFDQSGATPIANSAVWDGSSWSQFGQGLSGQFSALAVTPSGEVYAGGIFTVNDGVTTSKSIARWNGTAWTHVGTGMTGSTQSPVDALAVAPNGDIIAAGAFSAAGGTPAECVARWDGTSWSALGSGIAFRVYALAFMPNGDLIAGGPFSTLGNGNPGNRVARWDGSVWAPVGTGFDQLRVYALGVMSNGDLIAGGDFTSAGGVAMTNLARFNGTSWSAMPNGSPNLRVRSLLPLPDGDVIVGGEFQLAGTTSANGVARHSASGWSNYERGINYDVRAVAALPDGGAVAAGRFTAAGGSEARYISIWDGAQWAPLGSGLGVPAVGVDNFAVLRLQNGDIIAGGSFLTAGGVAANRVARWDGSTWSPMGTGMNGPVRALAQMPNGDIIAGGAFTQASGSTAFRVARWEGTKWVPIGAGFGDQFGSSAVIVLLPLPNGDIIAGGQFGSNISRWNGTAWSSMGSLSGVTNARVNALAIHPNGDIYAGGRFDLANGAAAKCVARYDGTIWSPLPGGVGVNDSTIPEVFAVAVVPNGDVIIGGHFHLAGTTPVQNVARWNGTGWSSVGLGVAETFEPASTVVRSDVYALTMLTSGELAVGGGFVMAGGKPSAGFARFSDSPSPWVASQPDDVNAGPGATVNLEATPAFGLESISYRWQRNGVDVADGPGGASAGGGVVSGAGGFITATSGEPVTLSIAGVAVSDGGAYSVIFSNACADATSDSAALLVSVPPCLGDFNHDGSVNTIDLTAFLGVFGQSVPPCGTGDLNCDGVVNTLDLTAFLGRFGQACPT